jgi:hypothetical protein
MCKDSTYTVPDRALDATRQVGPDNLFQYSDQLHPGELRLLHVEPGVFKEELRCTLTKYARCEAPKYSALSYCWGNPSRPHTLVVNGRSFPITNSVYEALQHLRLTQEELVIWIDQLSINQDDLEEKGAQVRQMYRTYQDAALTWVWLGPMIPGYEDAMAVLETYCTTRPEAQWIVDHYHQLKFMLGQPYFTR